MPKEKTAESCAQESLTALQREFAKVLGELLARIWQNQHCVHRTRDSVRENTSSTERTCEE